MAPQPASRTAMASTTNLLFSAKSTRARIMSCPVSANRYACSAAPHARWSGMSAVSRTREAGYAFVIRLLSEHVVQNQRVGDNLLPWFEPRFDFLQIRVVGQYVSADHFHPAKLIVGRGNKNKIPIVHPQYGRCRDNRVHLHGLTAEGCPREHAQPHDSWIRNFDAHLGGTNARIEDHADVADLAFERVIGVSIQGDVRGVPEPHTGHVI